MMQDKTFNRDPHESIDPKNGAYLFKQFNALITQYASSNNLRLTNKKKQDIYNTPKQKLQYLAIIASGNNSALAEKAKNLLCLMQGRGIAIPEEKSCRKDYEFYNVILDGKLDGAKAKKHKEKEVEINGKLFTIEQLKNRQATADPVLIRNSDGTITIIGFNDYTWEARTYTRAQVLRMSNGNTSLLTTFAISDKDLENHLRNDPCCQIYYNQRLKKSWNIGLPVPSMKEEVNYKSDAKYMFTLGQHGSRIIPFYLYSLEKDHKVLRKRIEKYPEDFKIWWQSLYDKESQPRSKQLQNLFKLNHHELDEIAYKLDSDRVFFSKFSDSVLLALGLCANEPAPTQKADKKQKPAYQQIYKTEFYFNSIRYPEKLEAREKFLYCQFFYKKSANNEALKLDALNRILHCLSNNTNKEGSPIPDNIQVLSAELTKKIYPNDSASTNNEELKKQVADQLTELKSIKTANVSTTENEWGTMLKQLLVRLLYNIGFISWRFTLDSNTTISSASRQSRHFSQRGEPTFFTPRNEITLLPTENNTAQQMTNTIQ